MKPFKHLQVPVVDRAQVNSREGKGLNTMVWAMFAALIKQINTLLESLLKNVNPNFPLWGRCAEITIRSEAGYTPGIEELAVRHTLGRVPTRWIITGYRPTDGSLHIQYNALTQGRTPWTSTHVFFAVPEYAFPMEYKILLLP